MNSTELIAAVRESAALDAAADTDWTDARILATLSEQQHLLFERSIVKARQGYWLRRIEYALNQGQMTYGLPARCVAGGIERIQIQYDSAQKWHDVDEVDESLAQHYELASGQTGQTCRYVIRGETLWMLPAPQAGNYRIRIMYYQRPPRLIPAQTAGLVSGVTATTITVATGPVLKYSADGVTSSSLTIGDLANLVADYGWRQTLGTFYVSNVAGTVYTLTQGDTTVTAAMLQASPGVIGGSVYLRPVDQQEWPSIPDDFHRLLADSAAVKILTLRSMGVKAEELSNTCGPAMAQFLDMISPRVKSQAKVIVAPRMYRGLRRNWFTNNGT